ncbi:MAG: nucleotidyltransferase family protein [Planctomycetes bacterium]|nr:nucleotidyltransferase family protein [Planctomycetota bacterium]
MKLILLCAGFATRMYPLTLNKPKALLPIGNLPMINRIINKFISDGNKLETIYIVTNSKFNNHFTEWRKLSTFNSQLVIVNDGCIDDKTRLGAIGDLKLVLEKEKISSDFIVAAGDNLFNFDTSEFIEFSEHKRLVVACKDLKNKENLSLYGIVQINKENKVIDFEEKPAKPKSSLIATGIYYFGKEYIPAIFEYAKTAKSLDKSGDLIAWLSKNYQVYCYKLTGQWYDIGDTETYKEVCALYGDEFADRGL